MKVIFAIPTRDGSIRSECVHGLLISQHILQKVGIPYELFTISDCPYLPVARNTLASMFLNEDATDLFFIDADVGFDPVGVIRILEQPEELVAGIYPLKCEAGGYPVEIKIEDGVPIGQNGLLEANFLPTGFMRIKRIVFEKMMIAYPHLKYKDSVVEVRGVDFKNGFDFFNMGAGEEGSRYTTEDYAFCQRWRDIGGQCWVYPNINFTHIGTKAYQGNYHQHLLRVKS